MPLQRLTARGLIAVTETREPEGRDRRLAISFPPAVKPVLADLDGACRDFEAARLSGFTREEQMEYVRLDQRIQDNIRNILQ